ncbi:TonB-dependent receptor [Cellvibrio sp. KY-GH-1]|uniref:TonB-dependent receptor n=1 Tax=Cellvibrio sp. KY-GH-1 TaxID=2303332 RepID=UPI001247C570|nr:TonB-dependent receptor [Cellvibrio sp. KY-GH-1]QEY17752.1 TonB-dependent receptor [Cellvibrio sp. KY-GH-1]
MSRKVSFNKTMLATVIASSALSGFAFAQDDGSVEEVMVTGIRASLERAMDVKRNSSGVVDAISAEDMGKFPDTNLAESLQRITGVSIDRNNGEGSRITVRGFGPDYNMVTLNGRTMPTGSAYGGSSGADSQTRGGNSRAFDFANLASESVSGVEVFKTGKANVAAGGMGASVNIKTARPLDTAGFKATVGGKAVMDTTNRTGDDITPEVSGLVSWADDSEMFGVSLSASYQERDSGFTGATVNDWRVAEWGGGDSATIYDRPASAAIFQNEPEVGQLYSRPNDIRYAFSDQQRERTNAQLTLQFRPIEDLTATLDYTFAENSRTENRGEVTTWVQNGGNLTFVEFDNSAIATPKIIRESYNGTRDVGFSQQYRAQDDTLDSIGLNVDWAVNDQLTVNVDLHDSELESIPKGPGYAGELDVGVGAPIKTGASWEFAGRDLPSWTHTLDDSIVSNGNGALEEGDLSSSVMRVFSAEQLSDVTQAKVDASWKFDEGRFDFGIERREMGSNTISYNGNNNQVLGGWGASAPGEFPAGSFEEFNVAGEFDDFNTGSSPAIGFRADARDLANFLVSHYNGPQKAYIGVEDTQLGGVRNSKSNNDIQEDTDAFYVQLSTPGKLGGFEVEVLTGLRYEDTKQVSSSDTPLMDYFVWNSDNDFTRVDRAAGVTTSFTNSYDALLPNLDVAVKLTDDLVTRFSFSKTIARAGLGQLGAAVGGWSINGSSLNEGTSVRATGNNPMLKPLESSNFDLSVEWYFDEASYASAGIFEKRVINFIGQEDVVRTFDGIRDQTAGPRAQAARLALQSEGLTVDNGNLYAMMAILRDPVRFPNGAADFTEDLVQELGENCTAAACDFYPTSEDPLMEFTMSSPVNNKEAKIYGAEFAAQHFFGETGFGVMANYTIVRGDVKFDNMDISANQFALLGLSDTANLVLMYDNYDIEARLAYNWRDEFLNRTNAGSNNPGYIEAYSQIDMNVTYHLTESLDVSLEGINVTGEDRREHARNKDMLWGLDDLGARYQVGVRYTF